MAWRLTNVLLAAGVVLAVASCRSGNVADVPPIVTPPNGEVASYKVQIDVRDGKCVFNYDGPFKGQAETDLLAPCEFLRDPAGNIRSLELKNTRQNGGGTYSVIVMIGGPPANEGHSDKYMKQGCASETRTISLSVQGVGLGSHGLGLDLCPTSIPDEKLFTANSRHV